MWPQKMPESAANPSSIPHETMTVLHGEPQSPASGGISSLNRAPCQLGSMPRAHNFQKALKERKRSRRGAQHLRRRGAGRAPGLRLRPPAGTTSARPAAGLRTPLPHPHPPSRGEEPGGSGGRAEAARGQLQGCGLPVRCARGGAAGVGKERPGGCESWASPFLLALPHFCVHYTPAEQVIPGTRLYNPRTAILPAPAARTRPSLLPPNVFPSIKAA